MAAHGKRISQSISDRICAGRVMCIMFMVYVHINADYNAYGTLQAQGVEVFSSINMLFNDFFGRASVPLLSVTSGFLLAASRPIKYIKLLQKKLKITLIPHMSWNLLAMLLAVAAFYILGKSTNTYEGLTAMSAWGFVNDLFSITKNGTQVHLSFLRDIFVIYALYPVFRHIAKVNGGLLILLTVMLANTTLLHPLILRPSILVGFVVGVVLYNKDLDLTKVDKFFPITTVLVAICFYIEIYGLLNFESFHPFAEVGEGNKSDTLSTVTNGFKRFLMATYFWQLTRFVSRFFSKGLIQKMEFANFQVFLSHVLVAWVFTTVWQAVTKAPLGGGLYQVYYFLTPPIIFFLCYWARIYMKYLPNILQVAFMGMSHKPRDYSVTGGKTPEVQTPATSPAPVTA